MKLYFQAGQHRLAVDTETREYSTNYHVLGGWKAYVKVSAESLRELARTVAHDGYKETDNI